MVKALKVQMKSPTVQPVQPDPYRGLYSKYILQYPFTKIGWTGWTGWSCPAIPDGCKRANLVQPRPPDGQSYERLSNAFRVPGEALPVYGLKRPSASCQVGS